MHTLKTRAKQQHAGDGDGSCSDGDDDWCCGSEYYCSTDSAAWAESQGGILCPGSDYYYYYDDDYGWGSYSYSYGWYSYNAEETHCELSGFSEQECAGCCTWDDGQCWWTGASCGASDRYSDYWGGGWYDDADADADAAEDYARMYGDARASGVLVPRRASRDI